MTTHMLTAKTLKGWRDGDPSLESIDLIDVLPEGDYAIEHIPGAVNVPLGDREFEVRIQEFAGEPDSSKKVVVYCANKECDASSRAARKLETMGFRQVFDLQGGLAEWKEEGFATDSGSDDSAVTAH